MEVQSLYNDETIKNNSFWFLFTSRQGSVVVEFKLTFKRQLENEKALAALKEGIKDGKMGSLKVDPESLKVKRDNEGNLRCY